MTKTWPDLSLCVWVHNFFLVDVIVNKKLESNKAVKIARDKVISRALARNLETVCLKLAMNGNILGILFSWEITISYTLITTINM